MLIYVAGKYSCSDDKEKRKYLEIARETAKVILEKTRLIPIIPHAVTYDFEKDDRFKNWTSDDWLVNYCLPLLFRCSYMIVSCGHKDSYGVEKEIEFAEKYGIKVFKNIHELLEFCKLKGFLK